MGKTWVRAGRWRSEDVLWNCKGTLLSWRTHVWSTACSNGPNCHTSLYPGSFPVVTCSFSHQESGSAAPASASGVACDLSCPTRTWQKKDTPVLGPGLQRHRMFLLAPLERWLTPMRTPWVTCRSMRLVASRLPRSRATQLTQAWQQMHEEARPRPEQLASPTCQLTES